MIREHWNNVSNIQNINHNHNRIYILRKALELSASSLKYTGFIYFLPDCPEQGSDFRVYVLCSVSHCHLNGLKIVFCVVWFSLFILIILFKPTSWRLQSWNLFLPYYNYKFYFYFIEFGWINSSAVYILRSRKYLHIFIVLALLSETNVYNKLYDVWPTIYGTLKIRSWNRSDYLLFYEVRLIPIASSSYLLCVLDVVSRVFIKSTRILSYFDIIPYRHTSCLKKIELIEWAKRIKFSVATWVIWLCMLFEKKL